MSRKVLVVVPEAPVAEAAAAVTERQIQAGGLGLDGVKDRAGVAAPQVVNLIIIVVIGGAGKHSAYIPTFGATRSVTRALKRRDGQFARSLEELRY